MTETKIEIVGDIQESEWVDRWYQTRLDQFNHIEFMRIKTLDKFNTICRDAALKYDWTHKINSDFRDGDKGQHGLGKAIDCVFYKNTPGDVNVIDQFIFALSSNFNRVGFYPYWRTSGLHLDTKDNEHLYWWQGEDKIYHYGNNPSDILKWTV
ncbi:MAG: hypothetical protein ABII90_09930 [Bacteroidota bacterium]